MANSKRIDVNTIVQYNVNLKSNEQKLVYIHINNLNFE